MKEMIDYMDSRCQVKGVTLLITLALSVRDDLVASVAQEWT